MCRKDSCSEEAKSSLLVIRYPGMKPRMEAKAVSCRRSDHQMRDLRCSISFGAPITSAAKHPFQTTDGLLRT